MEGGGRVVVGIYVRNILANINIWIFSYFFFLIIIVFYVFVFVASDIFRE